MPTVSAHVAAAIASQVHHVFGVMGNGNAHFLDAIAGTGAEYIALRHEGGAVAAADAYQRAGGGIAAATTTYGPGYTNAITALAEAEQARSPLVLVVGDQPTSGPRPWDIDQQVMAASVRVRTFTVTRVHAAEATLTAIEHALATRSPVVLAIPYDLAGVEAGPVPELRGLHVPSNPEPSGQQGAYGIAQLAERLASAERPLLLAGRGAWLAGAGNALSALADATGAITASTVLGRGIFARPEFDLGVAGGFGAEDAMELVRTADVAVVFGAALNQFTMRFGELFAPETQVFQVDIAPRATHANVDSFLRGDARVVAEALVRTLAGRLDAASGWRESIDVAALCARDAGEEFAADGRLDPRPLARRLAELLPSDRVVVSDGGHFIGWSHMYWPVRDPDRVVTLGTAFQVIGLGWPSVPGAAAARPDDTVVLTTGDGGGLMALSDLESAIRVAGGRGLAVVWNDAAYGAEINLYGLKGMDTGPMLIPEVDFAAVAAALGAESVVVQQLSDLDRLAEWAERSPINRRFLVLDLRISSSVIAPYQNEILRQNS